MSVIIRLQNLPWSANALDIRQFFNGLGIPEGGVHIVGGELGDAFIAFSTDEDARQAFNLNSGKIKEVQIKLMLSSRTEMQKVIEAARNPLAAFMQTVPSQPMQSSLIPNAIPALIPDIKKDDKDRRRSRSRSRDRKERSRERDRRDRRRRDRSRSRSRDRRDRRRRDRSHSRDRRSRDRDRRSKERGRHSEDKNSNSNVQKEPNKIGVWEDPIRADPTAPVIQQAQALLSTLMPNTLEEARRNLNALAPPPLLLANRNGFPNVQPDFGMNRGDRNQWNGPGGGRGDFRPRTQTDNPNQARNQFGQDQRMVFGRNQRADGRVSRFDSAIPSDKTPLLERPPLLDRPPLLERPELANCCVRLRPFFGGYGEIRRFFQGIFIHNVGIKFVNDETGKRTGIVYIRFATPDGKEKALQRNGGLLKHQSVEIDHLEDSVFDNTIDRYQPDNQDRLKDRSPDRRKNHPYGRPPNHFSCITIEDLPLFTKQQDILRIFSDYSMQRVFLINRHKFLVACIKFASNEEAQAAVSDKTKLVFDGKPLNLRPCSEEEYQDCIQEDLEERNSERGDDDAEEKRYVESECVSLSGLPTKTTDRDISDFFSDVAIVPNKIHLITTNLGFTGEAFCEFISTDDAGIALEKDGLPLGSGTVTVKSVLRSEMEDALGIALSPTNPRNIPMQNPIRPFFQPRGFGRGSHGHAPPRGMLHRPMMRRFGPPPVNPNEMPSPGCTILMENVPYKAGLEEILEFFDGFDVLPDNVLRRYNDNGTPSGEAKVIFNSKEDAYQALQERHTQKIRDRTVYLSLC